MEFIPQEIEEYSTSHSESESELLQLINRETHAKVLMPRMLSGHLQGRVLSMFSRMIRPNRILELGTFTGYSALCLAEGLTEKGRLITIDINEELEDMVRGFFSKSSYSNQIDYCIGNALDIIPTLDEKFDLVFIDADKKNYQAYYEMIFNKVNKGGFIIFDNVLWSGKVADESCRDKDTQAIRAINDRIHLDNRVKNVLVPIRDGLLIAELC